MSRPAAESPTPQELQGTAGPSAVAQYDYEATEENELSFPEEAIIEDVEFPDDDWWLGTYHGRRGLFVCHSFPIYLAGANHLNSPQIM